MQGLRHVRSVEMKFTATAILHKAHELELGAIQFRKCLGMEDEGLASQVIETESSDSTGRALKSQLN
ncbi:MAG: Uncharacterised protein [Prochlorococcus marinus str. MIT 9313]|nr:MAG: Uncharacterised protein [Prochlorococcus marinus str. MIT 9313]